MLQNIEESPDRCIPGMERKLRLVIASVLAFYPHVKLRTGPESTGLESNRDEWV